MNRKTLYLDCETTGTDPGKHGLVQLACIVEIDDEVKAEQCWGMRPFHQDVIEPEALKVIGRTREEIMAFEDPTVIFPQVLDFLCRFVDKYDRADKFYAAGYNVRFDMDFLKAFWQKNGDVYFGSFFNGKPIDPLPWLIRLDWLGQLSLPEYKLSTVCRHYGIELGDQAHDALADVRATRALIKLLS